MAFIEYSPLFMTSWTVVTVGQKGLVGKIVAAEMLIFKWYKRCLEWPKCTKSHITFRNKSVVTLPNPLVCRDADKLISLAFENINMFYPALHSPLAGPPNMFTLWCNEYWNIRKFIELQWMTIQSRSPAFSIAVIAAMTVTFDRDVPCADSVQPLRLVAPLT